MPSYFNNEVCHGNRHGNMPKLKTFSFNGTYKTKNQ